MSQYNLDLKVLNLLEEFEDKIDNLAVIPLTGKVMLDRDEIQEIIREINILLPEEYQHVKWIKSQKNQIMDEAQQQADAIVMNAQQDEMKIVENAKMEEARMMAEVDERMHQLVDEHQIVRQAKERAEEIIMEAERLAEDIKEGAYEYAEDMLLNLRKNIVDATQTVEQNLRELSGYRRE